MHLPLAGESTIKYVGIVERCDELVLIELLHMISRMNIVTTD